MAELMTLARPYAKAAFEVALADGALGEWQSMLDTASAVAEDNKVAEKLRSPALTSEQQTELMQNICGDSINAKVVNLIRALAVNRRIALLAQISKQFGELKAKREKTVSVELCSAFPMDALASESLSRALSKKWDCNVALETIVDPALLGGVVIKAGDMVIDASIRGRMLKLAEALTA
jgi:F-type H+-transporting ATPase subunit delta